MNSRHSLGNTIRRLRDYRQRSIDSVAAEAGIEVEKLARIEAGAPMDVETINRIAMALGVPDARHLQSVSEMIADYDAGKLINVRAVRTATALMQLAYSSEACSYHIEKETPEIRNATVALVNYMREWVDSGASPEESQKAEHQVALLLKDIEVHGAHLFGYRRPRDYRITDNGTICTVSLNTMFYAIFPTSHSRVHIHDGVETLIVAIDLKPNDKLKLSD